MSYPIAKLVRHDNVTPEVILDPTTIRNIPISSLIKSDTGNLKGRSVVLPREYDWVIVTDSEDQYCLVALYK